MTLQRLERFNASLLPYQSADDIKETMVGLERRLTEIDIDDSLIGRVEQENAKLIQEAKERAARRKGRGRLKKPGKPAFKRIKTGIPGMDRIGKVKV